MPIKVMSESFLPRLLFVETFFWCVTEMCPIYLCKFYSYYRTLLCRVINKFNPL